MMRLVILEEEMPHYMTNTILEDEEICIKAANNTGFDVRFERNPMPAYADTFVSHDEDEDHYAAIRHRLVGQLGCVVSYESNRDHGPFWDEWDRLKGRLK